MSTTLTTVICRAPHPSAHLPRFADRRFHGVFIAKLPFHLQPTSRVFPPRSWDAIDHEGGCLGVQCPDKSCRMISEYRRTDHPAGD